MISMLSWMKKQIWRNDPIGDFARDFLELGFTLTPCRFCETEEEREKIKHMDWKKEYEGEFEFEVPKRLLAMSDTLFGMQLHVQKNDGDFALVGDAMRDAWREWVSANHVGIHARAKKGYVYFLEAPTLGLFKIGRTQSNPRKRLIQVQVAAKTKVVHYNWLYTSYYDVIEKELHRHFAARRQVGGEWFRLTRREVAEALVCYAWAEDDVRVFKKDRIMHECLDSGDSALIPYSLDRHNYDYWNSNATARYIPARR